MSACEMCWSRAQTDAMLLGGSVVEHYRRRVAEEQQHATHEPTGPDS